jgi:hypothetical protein
MPRGPDAQSALMRCDCAASILAVRWLREQARARRFQEEQMRRDVRRTLWAAVAAVLVGIVGIGIALLR